MTDLFLLEPSAISRAIESLLEREIHPHFPAYIGLKWTAAREGREQDLEWDYWGFFERFMKLPGGAREADYYRPFWNEDVSEEKAWFKSNVAGSYSPASISRIPAIMEVIDVDTGAGTYSLRDKHWELARQHLLYEEQAPVVPLAVFLYRDFELQLPDASTFAGLIDIFRADFGYPDIQGGNVEFGHLYNTEWTKMAPEDCFTHRATEEPSGA